jgi:hypothetical protein
MTDRMQVWDVELLQQRIREAHLRVVGAMQKALKSCRSEYERQRCLDAYTFILRTEEDVIGQRHGLPPMKWAKRHD